MSRFVQKLKACQIHDVPPAIRPHVLEIEGTRAGLKPGYYHICPWRRVPETLRYLLDEGLHCVVETSPDDERTGRQLSPSSRDRLLAEPRARIYSARLQKDAEALRDADLDARDPALFGHLLGYPQCCIDYVCSADQIKQTTDGKLRQSNLNALAISQSTAAFSLNNRLLSESVVASYGPPSAIAHYPCRLNCLSSDRIGALALELCLRRWPAWSMLLAELLRAPMLYIDDSAAPEEQWSEHLGLCFPGGQLDDQGIRGDTMMRLSDQAALLPIDVQDQEVIDLPNPFLPLNAWQVPQPYRVTSLDWRFGRVAPLR